MQCITEYRGVEQLVARRAHNPEVASSSLVPATTIVHFNWYIKVYYFLRFYRPFKLFVSIKCITVSNMVYYHPFDLHI